ncbi:DUF2523 domain-containing protein [Chromobacterium phragmitis]|uniref:DUF2523 domain-containing protein n=1 Tax=Chromobacterium amazonense TaxID=1382803 RepID=UPI0021B83FF6|nr:DUF2523 domain-containing protein [Chromobacterium amazonense]MBM2883872.1 DUF2523 domain-containing protein [Chromobacterium amazonense]MDE1716255.1 DUF2523 domain-containing protein [Chromobacterium amazonense]
MPVIAAIAWGVVALLLETIVSRVITAIGFGMISYSGVSAFLGGIKSSIASSGSSVSSAVASILAMSGFGTAISILFSAITIRATLDGMDKAGNLVRSKWKGFKG